MSTSSIVKVNYVFNLISIGSWCIFCLWYFITRVCLESKAFGGDIIRKFFYKEARYEYNS
jgi:hypothetical protein